MGFLYGFVGAVLGAILGSTTALFLVAVATGGDEFALTLAFMTVVPAGLIFGATFGLLAAIRLRRFVQGNQKDKAAKRRSVLTIAGCVLAVPVLAATMLWVIRQLGQPPSDQQLLSNYKHHKATFGELAQMAQTDKSLARVDYNWTDPSDPQKIGISPARIAEYRSLLESVGLHRGFQSRGLADIEFISYGQGSAMSSDTFKGYMYLAMPPKQVLRSLDGCQPDEKNGVEAYRHIEGHWYLYYEYLPD